MPIESDVVISWFIGVPPQTQALFSRPTTFIHMDTPKGRAYGDQIRALGRTPLQEICRRKDITPLRVALLGFSEGCSGVREALGSGDGTRVDSAIAIDGIHTEYNPVGVKGGKVEAAQLKPWLAQAEKSAVDGRLCLITTSSIVPARKNKQTGKWDYYVSTTDTANIIWRDATGTDQDIQSTPAPNGMWATELATPMKLHCDWGNQTPRVYAVASTYRYRRQNGLIIWNYANQDSANSGCMDHIFQAKFVSPQMIGTYLAQRWNVSDPKTGGVTLVSGLPERRRGFGAVSRMYETLGDDPPAYGGAGVLLPMDAPPAPPDLSKWGSTLTIPGAPNDVSPPPAPPPAAPTLPPAPPAPQASQVELPEVTITPAEPPVVATQAKVVAREPSAFAKMLAFVATATATAVLANAVAKVMRRRRPARA